MENNKIRLIGHLSDDSITRKTGKGKDFVTGRMKTVDTPFKDKEVIAYHSFITFDDAPMKILGGLGAGSHVTITGSVRYSKKDDKFYTSIHVEDAKLISGGPPKESQEGGNGW